MKLQQQKESQEESHHTSTLLFAAYLKPYKLDVVQDCFERGKIVLFQPSIYFCTVWMWKILVRNNNVTWQYCCFFSWIFILISNISNKFVITWGRYFVRWSQTAFTFYAECELISLNKYWSIYDDLLTTQSWLTLLSMSSICIWLEVVSDQDLFG